MRLERAHPSVYARGTLDNGSQGTFIKKNVSKNLNLEPVGEVEMAINIFGHGSGVQCARHRLVRVTDQGQFDDALHEIEAVEVRLPNLQLHYQGSVRQ